jgi:hypothetical protein
MIGGLLGTRSSPSGVTSSSTSSGDDTGGGPGGTDDDTTWLVNPVLVTIVVWLMLYWFIEGDEGKRNDFGTGTLS